MCLMFPPPTWRAGLGQEHSVLCLLQIHTHSRPGTHCRSQKCQLFAKGALDNLNLRSNGLQGCKHWGRTLGTRHKKWAALLSSLTPAGRGSPTDRRLHMPDPDRQRPGALTALGEKLTSAVQQKYDASHIQDLETSKSQ